MLRKIFIPLFVGMAASLSGYATDLSVESDVVKTEYSFAFLGDLHFDRLEHHDIEWVKENHPGDIRQIADYCNVTKQSSGALLQSASDLLQKRPAPFAMIQVGDFVEGLCGSYDLQKLQFEDAIDFVEPFAGSLPFLITKGNHDITGPGSVEAYEDVILPWTGKQLDTEIDRTSYIVKHQGDLFVFFDGYKPDLDWLEKVLKENPARHLFFIVHEPVVPYNARSQWYLFSRSKTPEQRERLLNLLGEYRAIVLCGHLHHYSVVRRKTDKGSFVQLSMGSVVRPGNPSVELIEDVEKYTPDLVDLEPGFGKESKEARRTVLENEMPSIEYFEVARVPGCGVLSVSGDAVEMDVYIRSEATPWRKVRIDTETLDITGLML